MELLSNHGLVPIRKGPLLAIDQTRQPTRLGKILKAYVKAIYPVPAEADESHVLTELIADIFQWIGDWRKARTTAQLAEQSYQARMLGVISEQYGRFKTQITEPLPHFVAWHRTEAHVEAIGGRHRKFKDPHDFVAFYFQLHRDGWWPRVFFMLPPSGSAGIGRLSLQVNVAVAFDPAVHTSNSFLAELAYIERGPKRLLGIMQEIAERAEIEPPPPQKLEGPGDRPLRHIDL